MKVVEFYLQWKDKIFDQVIVWWSIIEIKIIIQDYSWEEVFLDISNYSKKWIYQIFPQETFDIDCTFVELIEVEFIWEDWILCKKDDLNSRVKIVVNWTSYFSNTIGSYEYRDNFLLKESNFYTKWDHHLWVYNKDCNNYKDKILEITEIDTHPNDIIFINRKYSYVKDIFINLEDDIKIIFYKYKINLLRKEKSIFFIDLLLR